MQIILYFVVFYYYCSRPVRCWNMSMFSLETKTEEGLFTFFFVFIFMCVFFLFEVLLLSRHSCCSYQSAAKEKQKQTYYIYFLYGYPNVMKNREKQAFTKMKNVFSHSVVFSIMQTNPFNWMSLLSTQFFCYYFFINFFSIIQINF